MSQDIIPGFPACSHDHAPVNMRLVDVFALDDGKDDETWNCPSCGSTFRCVASTREVPEVLR